MFTLMWELLSGRDVKMVANCKMLISAAYSGYIATSCPLVISTLYLRLSFVGQFVYYLLLVCLPNVVIRAFLVNWIASVILLFCF